MRICFGAFRLARAAPAVIIVVIIVVLVVIVVVRIFNGRIVVIQLRIARLREKMHENSRRPKFIKTVWGVGYTIE